MICITSLSHFTRSSSIGERLCGGHHGDEDEDEDDGGDEDEDDNEDGDNIILAKCGHWRVELPNFLLCSNKTMANGRPLIFSKIIDQCPVRYLSGDLLLIDSKHEIAMSWVQAKRNGGSGQTLARG